jgi:hypothetical protein
MPTMQSWAGLSKLEIRVPTGQLLFIWDCGGESTTPITAADEDEAYRKVIAFRMTLVEGTEQEKLEEAIRHFRKNDTLLEVDCDEIEIAPYAGELPED